MSQALTVILDQSLDPDIRRQLVVALVQRGIDYLGAYADGRQNWMVDGGHMWGRWPLVMLAGILLDIPQAIHPDPILQGRLVERQAFYTGQPAWWNGWPFGWRRGWTDQPFLWRQPASWTTTERGERWAINGYLPHVVGAHVGTVLAMRAMGHSWDLGEALTGMVEQWMAPLPDTIRAELDAAGCQSVTGAWGQSYAATGDAQLCADAWRRVYRP